MTGASTEQLDLDRPPHPPSTGPAYNRLSHQQLAILLRLHSDGKNQQFIADALGVSQSAISYAIKRLGVDTTEIARFHLKARSYSAAQRVTAIAEKGKPEVAIKAARLVLNAAGVITEGVTGIVGVQVMIGTSSSPALQADTVEVEVLDGTATPQSSE